MRRSVAVGCAVVAAGGLAAAGYFVAGSSGDDASADTAPDAANLSFATVTRGDLVRYEEFDGTTGYGDTAPVVLHGEGTITATPAVGQLIGPGDTIAEIDGRPVIAAQGTMPMWRDLGPGVDDGVDVLQVEQLLAQLGYATEYDVTVDEDWTDATTRAVRAFQEDRGLDDDGVIGRDELVFFEGTVRVAAVGGVPGEAVADAGIEVSGTLPVVSFEVDAAAVDLVADGDQVDVELADGATVPGAVTAIGPVTVDEQGSATVTVELTLEATVISGLAEGSAVDVKVPVVSATAVLSVPVEALLAVAEGGYAVEVRDGATTRLVGVETGAFADGRVEIAGTTGEITDGQEVVIP